MHHYSITPGAINQTVEIFVPDSSSSVGAGLTGLAFGSAGLTCYYVRSGAAAAQLTLVAQTVAGAHIDGGFIEIDATNMPGVYRLDLSDAVCAAGAANAMIVLRGAGNMVPTLVLVELGSGSVVPGSIEYTYTITDSVTGLPISSVDVWISTDNATPPTNVVWRGTTDAFGVLRDASNNKPWLDPGTYYFWLQHENYLATNPDTEVVS